MILGSKVKEIFIAQHAIDFRKGADGLIGECYAMGLDPYVGECVVFVHRSRRKVKVIGGDAHGVWVLLRRFEGGALKEMFPFLSDPSFVSATPGELSLLLEGATCEVKAKASPWKKERQGDKGKPCVIPKQTHGKEKVQSKSKEACAEIQSRGFPQSTCVGQRA